MKNQLKQIEADITILKAYAKINAENQPYPLPLPSDKMNLKIMK
jgi:hypothetical protein